MAGWVTQDKNRLNLHASLGVAVREMDTDSGPADYMLFIAGKACGIIEAKREGAHLGGVAEQSARYAASNTKHIERWAPDDQPLPFLFEATNHEIRFRDERDPHPRSRFIFHFYKPETLKDWLEEGTPLRSRIQNDLPELITKDLRTCRIDAIHGIELSLKQGKPRALLQMATGSGKTYTAVTEVYRLAKFARVTGAQRRVCLMKPEGVLKGKSQSYYEHMKGRGTRIISRDELHKVTPDAPGKSRSVLVDCVGVYESATSAQNLTNSNYNTADLRAA